MSNIFMTLLYVYVITEMFQTIHQWLILVVLKQRFVLSFAWLIFE